jgi:hypothetical protein
MLSAVLALSACAQEPPVTIAVPIETPTPSKPNAVRPGTARLMSVETLYAWCQAGRLMIIVDARTNSGGWTGGRLNPLPTIDGLRTFEAVAVPPSRRGATMAIESMRIAHEETPPHWLERVRVLSQTNQLEAVVKLGPC